MSVSVTPPNQSLQLKAKPSGKSGAGVTRPEAVTLGNAALAARLGDARAELERLVGVIRDARRGCGPVVDDRHELLKAARELADTGGTFGHHAMTEVGRSLEGYLIALMGTGRAPDPTVGALHAEALGVLLAQDARGALGAGETELLRGLHKVAAKALDRGGPV